MRGLRAYAIFGIILGIGMYCLTYYFATHLMDPKNSLGDGFILILMGYSGTCAIIEPSSRYIETVIEWKEAKKAYKQRVKNKFALFNRDYWSEHNLDDFPNYKREVKRLGIDKELPTARDCRIYLYGYDPYEKNPPPKIPNFNKDNTAFEVACKWYKVPEKYYGKPLDWMCVKARMTELGIVVT